MRTEDLSLDIQWAASVLKVHVYSLIYSSLDIRCLYSHFIEEEPALVNRVGKRCLSRKCSNTFFFYTSLIKYRMQLRSALHFLLRHLFQKGEKHKKGEIAWEKIFCDLDIMKNKMVLEITELRKIYQIHNKYMDIYLYVSSYLDSRCLHSVCMCVTEREAETERNRPFEKKRTS